MPSFRKKVTAHDDGHQTVQKEFLDPKTKKVHSDESKKQKALDENEIRRRKTIAKIYKDTTLTPKEKNDRIQSLLKESEKVRDQPTQGSKQVDEDNDIGRRKKIGSIFKDSGLTPKEKLERISPLATEKEKVQEEEGTEDAQTAQRREIQDVYEDNKLSSQEKHERIQEIMKGEDIVGDVDNDDDLSHRSGSDRSGSYSSRRSSDYSGSYSRSAYSDDYSSRGSRSRQEPRGSRSGQEPEQAMVRASSLTQQNPKGTKEDCDTDTVVDEEEKGNPRRRMICCIVFTLILVAAIAGPLLSKYWDDITGKEGAPTEAPTEIPEPTAFPTELVLLYDPLTDAQCFAISSGNDIVGQGDLDSTSFDIEIDVALSNDNLDFESLVATLEERMQERIAPSLAGCPADSRRLTGLGGIRILNDKRYVIRNAKVNAELDTGLTCNVQEPCFSVLTRLTLFLAGPEDTSVLTNRINDLFNQDLTLENLGLTDPFRGLTFVGATASSPTNTPTFAPSVMPSPNPSASSSPTVEPSSAPTTKATQTPIEDPSSIRRPIIESALETIGPLDDLNQHAVDWMIQDDTWLPDDTSDASVWIQRYVLYILFEETCGHEWQEHDGWLDATSICDGWFGVSCDGDDNEATGLQLDSNHLYGPIPTELGLLSTLKTLNLAINELEGRLPSDIGKLTNLLTLNLIDTDLSGTIPTELGGLASVEQLNIDDNDLRGQIPTEFGLLTNLFNVSLWENRLTGTIPSELGKCTSLGVLLLPDNHIGGKIPTHLFALPALETLELDNNELEGLIPSEIGNLTTLTRLEVDDNHLNGDIPALPTSLAYCDLERNFFDNEDNAVERGCKV